jgi:uncharacterized protein YraI
MNFICISASGLCWNVSSYTLPLWVLTERDQDQLYRHALFLTGRRERGTPSIAASSFGVIWKKRENSKNSREFNEKTEKKWNSQKSQEHVQPSLLPQPDRSSHSFLSGSESLESQASSLATISRTFPPLSTS